MFRQNAEDFKKTVLVLKGLGYTDPPVREREGSVLQICEMGSSSNLPEEPWRDRELNLSSTSSGGGGREKNGSGMGLSLEKRLGILPGT